MAKTPVIRPGQRSAPARTSTTRITGVFAIGYGVARIICEFFREPDPQLGFLFGAATMGMLLSAPLIAVGAALIARARRSGPQENAG